MEGEAPQLQTDRFDPSAPGQTLVVTLGSSEAHLNVEDGVEAILDAFSHPVLRNGDLIALTPEPEKVPPLPDAERLCAEVNIAPVNDSPDAATGARVTLPLIVVFPLALHAIMLSKAVA